MLLFEAEDQPGVVPDLNGGVSPASVDDIQFDLDFQSILPDNVDLKTPQLQTANQWDPNALRRFSFSNITGLQTSNSGPFEQINDNVFTSDSVPQQDIRVKTEGAVVIPPNPTHQHTAHPMPPSKFKRQRTPSMRAREAAAVATMAAQQQTRARKMSSPRTAAPIRNNGKAGKNMKNRAPSPIPLNTHGILPADHRPARGRGRQNQLARMTKQQIEAEADARLEKNRQAARECRLRRKHHVELLENRVSQLERERRQQDKIIKQLQAKLATASA